MTTIVCASPVIIVMFLVNSCLLVFMAAILFVFILKYIQVVLWSLARMLG